MIKVIYKEGGVIQIDLSTQVALAQVLAARDEARKWATEAEDTEVNPGLYSAFHWATKTQKLLDGVDVIPGTPGADGSDGREVELQVNATHIQWRYVGDLVWNDLIALTALEGPAGPAGADGAQGLPGADGADGADGREVELQVNATHIQWRYVGAPSWTDLIALSALEGPAGPAGPAGADGADGAPGVPGADGADGAPGIDGREVEFQTNATHVQWRYVGDPTWTDLIALADITGPPGSGGSVSAELLAYSDGIYGDNMGIFSGRDVAAPRTGQTNLGLVAGSVFNNHYAFTQTTNTRRSISAMFSAQLFFGGTIAVGFGIDANNYVQINFQSAGIQVQEKVAGVLTTLGSASIQNLAGSHRRISVFLGQTTGSTPTILIRPDGFPPAQYGLSIDPYNFTWVGLQNPVSGHYLTGYSVYGNAINTF